MTLTTEMRDRYETEFATLLGAPRESVELSDTLAAFLMAKDLMCGVEAENKAGYTPENAHLAVLDVFPEAESGRLAIMLGLPRDTPGNP